MAYQIYRQLFTRAECKMLDACPQDSPLSELSLMRILLRRVLEATRARRSGDRARRPQAAIAHSGPIGDRSIPHSPSKRNHTNALPLKSHLSMLAAFGHSGIIMASLVRYHRTHVTSDISADPWLSEFAIKDLSDL